MDDLTIYNDPIIAHKRKGTVNDPFKQITETLTVNMNYVLLTEKPNRFYRVQIKGEFYEIEDGELSNNTYRVDYVNGVVYFHNSLNGKNLTFSYMGEGVLLFPDSRIYVSNNRQGWTLRDKLADLDRLDLEQKNRVENLIRSTPQPSEIVDVRTDRNGKVYPVAKERIDAEQKKIEDAQVDLNGKKHSSLKARVDADQKMVEDAFKSSNRKQLFDSLDKRLLYDYEDMNNIIDTEIKNLKAVLDSEIKKLQERIKKEVNVVDFGAKGDGVTDDTEAFKKAIGNGRVKVNIPAGTFIVKGIKLPSYTYLIGQGKGVTILKLHDSTVADERVIINKDYKDKGNTHIYVKGMTLDWNQKRQGGLKPSGGSKSSCLTYSGVRFGWVKDVEGINGGLHGFDVTCIGDAYPYNGDGTVVEDSKRSKYIWFDGLIASNYDDDGITTHHSDYIFISNSHAENPRGRGNCNGIEIDDGSRHVFLRNNSTRGTHSGIEVKGHEPVSAAQNVHIDGHVSINDCRSYDFRHIGHHRADDSDSKTAYDITANNLVSIEPISNGIYEGYSPRALVISAYRNVSISNFTAIGNPNYDFQGNPVIAVQFKSRNISLNNINIRGFKKAGQDIRIFGGAQKADNVNISNVNIYKSAPNGIALGGGVYNVNVNNVIMVGENGTVGISSPNNQTSINNVVAEGYKTPAEFAGKKYDHVPNNFKGGTRISTTSGYAKGITNTIIASTVDPIAEGSKTVAMASSKPRAKGNATLVAGTTGGCETKGIRNAIVASSGASSTDGSRAFIAATNNSHIKGNDKVARTILSSNGVINDNSYTVVGGYGSGGPSTANKKWEISSTSGNIKASGNITGSSTFSDYAEYFESVDGKKILTGSIVTLVGDKIKLANRDDHMLGIISETAGVVLGEASFHWKDRYERNEFGGLIYEKHLDENGREFFLPKENPEWNEEMDYVSRSEREEWNVVGLLGQVYVRCSSDVSVGDYIQANNGLAVKSDDYGQGWRVMKITSPFSKAKGYGVALCFIR